MDSDNEVDEESKREERIVVKHSNPSRKRQQFDGPRQPGHGQGGQVGDQNEGAGKPYGNTYGKKGQSNNISFLHNDELRASMWQTHGFILDRNLSKLG
jgi:hypothetical protein